MDSWRLRMKSMLKDAAILFAITLVAGFLLGAVYDVTKEPIAIQTAKKKNEACKEVFADAVNFEAMETAEGVEGAPADVDAAYQALAEDGTLMGYVLEVTTHEGYNGDIQFAMGIRLDGTVNGISLLSIAETPGLGMKAEEVLKPQFTQKKASQFIFTKTGATAEEQIDAISGATITTNAVVVGVNTGLAYFQNELGGTANE